MAFTSLATNLVANGVLRLLGISREKASTTSLSREELRTVVAEASTVIPHRHQRMLMSILDLERVSAARPDLILIWGSGYPPATIEAVRRLGVAVFVSEPSRLADIALADGALMDAESAVILQIRDGKQKFLKVVNP